MSDNRNLQAPWVGKSDWEYLGWKTEEEEWQEELAEDEEIDRLIDEMKDDEALRVLEAEYGNEE